jgi:orotidine-5'-phosphate decarboxylase
MNNPIIVALDVSSAAEARSLVRAIGPAVRFYKVGLELYTAAGMDLVRELIAEGNDVFLDLKFFDIAETVKRAVAQAATSGARFLTVHASVPVMRAAVVGRGDSRLQLLAVTVLTNYDRQDLDADGYSRDVADLVSLRVRNAKACGVDGIVCSSLEVQQVHQIVGDSMILVTPGVRSAGADHGDQKRVATPLEAVRHGAKFLVIGREITRAAQPAAAAQRILDDLRRPQAI